MKSKTKERRKGNKISFLKKSKRGLRDYCDGSKKNVLELSKLFGNKKTFGCIGFAFQPIVAIGQFVFHYSILITIAYVLAFNFLLFRLARKKFEESILNNKEHKQ